MWGQVDQSLYLIENNSGNELVYADSSWYNRTSGSSWYFYSVESNPYQLEHELHYSCFWDEDSESSTEGYTLDGREIGESEADLMLNKVRGGLKILQIDESMEGLELLDLLTFLKENNDSDNKETNPLNYASVIQQAINRRNEAGAYGGEGMLYDIDGNGTKELMLMYDSNIDIGYGEFPHMVFSLYTIQNEVIITLIDDLPLYTEAGGPSGHAGIVSIDGERFLAVTWESGETGGGPGDMTRGGEWYLYRVDSSTATLHTKVEYEYVISDDYNGNSEILYDRSSAIFNGNPISYEDYELWVDNMIQAESVDGIIYNNDELIVSQNPNLVDNGISLEDLLLMY